jgi:hypothetical protein
MKTVFTGIIVSETQRYFIIWFSTFMSCMMYDLLYYMMYHKLVIRVGEGMGVH